MKKSIILTGVLMIIAGLSIVLVTKDSTVINLHSNGTDMTDQYHIFRQYESYIDAFRGVNAVDSAKIEIDTNGNYICNPTKKEFAIWLAAAVENPEAYFSTVGYVRFLQERRNELTDSLN